MILRTGRAVIVVLSLVTVLLSGCSRSTTADSPEPVAITVTFTDEATAREMAAFFEGFNAGSFAGRVETKTLTLDSDQRSMNVTFESAQEADSFAVVAEQADVVEVVKRSER